MIIPAGSSADVGLVVNLTDDVEFQGNLASELTAFDASQEERTLLFSFTVRLRVIPGSETASTGAIPLPVPMGTTTRSVQPLAAEGP
jgi:hypothetical protein